MTNVKETIRKIDITFLRELVNTRDNSSIRNDSTFIQKKKFAVRDRITAYEKFVNWKEVEMTRVKRRFKRCKKLGKRSDEFFRYENIE